MLPDPKNILRDVDCLLREVESLAERLDPALRDVQRKVDALECLQKGLAAFGASEALTPLSAEIGALRTRVCSVSDRLRAAMLLESDGAARSVAEGTVMPLTGVHLTIAANDGTGPLSEVAHAEGAAPSELGGPGVKNHGPVPSNGDAHGVVNPGGVSNGTGNHGTGNHSTVHTGNGHSAELPPVGSRIPLFGKYGARTTAPWTAPAPIQPPDPEDLERIRLLEEECEREFAKLPFAGDEGRHCILTLCAAKARRLRPKLRDSYAVDRRVGELIRRIVDLKRRYRLGWIDGCERNFDVPDWDAYVQRCEETLREMRAREHARHDEARVARERAGLIAGEVDRRGRELRHYLDTDEGARGTEPEKLRAVLMSYLAVEGAIDIDLLEKLRIHKNLFTGIAFRRIRKALERSPGSGGFVGEEESKVETLRMRERILARTRGCRGVIFASASSDDARRRLEQWLGLDRLIWIDMGTLDAAAWSEFASQVQLNEMQWVFRAPSNSSDAVSPWSENQLRDILRRGNVRLIDVDRIDDLDAFLASVERALASDAARP